jgi:hypothetical protein
MRKDKSMSLKAMNYVKSLVDTEQGKAIRGTKWSVLWLLASFHNDQVGGAWPSIGELARHSGISKRYCRASLAFLEKVGVVVRISTRNLTHGGQSSNIYLFSAIGDSSEKFFKSLDKVIRVPRAPMARSRGSWHPVQSDVGVRGGETDISETPGGPVPPIESLRETASEYTRMNAKDSIATPNSQSKLSRRKHEAGRNPQKPEIQNLAQNMKEVCTSVSLGQIAWNSSVEELRKSLFPTGTEDVRDGFVSGAKDWRSYRLEKATVVKMEMNNSGAMIMMVRSPNPKSTARGLKTHASSLESALTRFFGCAVILRLDTGR